MTAMRLNLLPPSRRRRGPMAHTAVAMGVAALLIFTALVYAGLYFSLAAARHNLAQVENRLALLQPAEENMRQVQNLLQRRDRKRTVLTALSGQHRSCYDTLLRVSGETPDSVWFRAVRQDGATVQVQGWARSYQDMGDFVRRLEADGSFRTVTVTEAKDDGRLPLTDFTLLIYYK